LKFGSLSQRFDLAAAELRRLGGTPIFPATEIALQQMQKEIARLTPKPVPPPEPDFFVKRAISEKIQMAPGPAVPMEKSEAIRCPTSPLTPSE
jgi:hypothetical protein